MDPFQQVPKPSKALLITGIILAGFALLIAGSGILYKLMHWPFGSLLLIIGASFLIIAVALLLVYVAQKK